ncbi:MAG: hypothetical protein LBL37_00855 [Gracilibacteraceae bacterium]|jgi:hypothetical protein|nr:hypothetical protein [Gracilibacteraceae bacterium]
MSGPKVSVYEISAEQRRNLQAQVNCSQQSLVCREEIKRSVGYLNEAGGQIRSLLSTFELANRRTNDCSAEISILTGYQGALPRDSQLFLRELAGIPVLQTDKFTPSETELAKRKETLARLQALRNKAAAKHREIEAALPSMEKKAKQGAAAVKGAIADDVAGVQSFFVRPPEAEDENFAADKKKVVEQLRALTSETACPGELIGEVRAAAAAAERINSKEQLQTFQAVTVRPLQNRIEAAAMQKQYDLVAQVEQAYISDCVNEVMAEMGYDVIGSRTVVKRSGKRFRNELFSYGDGTAINVTYDPAGQIAIELGGIDRTDRIPTAEEAEALHEDMESFCSDFGDFEERLQAKGVLLKSRVSLAPPAAEYAAIINLTDYTVTAAAPVQEIAVTGKRSKTAKKRAMLNETEGD